MEIKKSKLVEKKMMFSIISFIIIMIFSFLFVNSYATQMDEKEKEENANAQTTTVNISEPEKETDENFKGIFDSKMFNSIYKVSEDKFHILPFFRFATDRILIDKEISGMGTMFSATSVEVNSPMKGLQVLLAGDTVRVNSNMEYAIIFAGNNVVIEGTLNKPAIILAGQNITIAENAILNDDIICYSNSLTVNGKAKGSVLGASNQVSINGHIEKDLRIQALALDIANNDNITGNIYVETYTEQLNISEKYPNAIVNVIKIEKKAISYEIVMNAIISCLLFTLVYVIIARKTKGKLYERLTHLTKNNLLFVVLSGSIALLAMPAIVVLLIVLAMFGLYAIAVPMLIIYVMGVLVIGLLSTFIVGSLLANYMSKNYFKDKSTFLNICGTFFVFMSLYILARLPYVGGYVTMALVLIANGMIMAYLFKKNHKVENNSNRSLEKK